MWNVSLPQMLQRMMLQGSRVVEVVRVRCPSLALVPQLRGQSHEDPLRGQCHGDQRLLLYVQIAV